MGIREKDRVGGLGWSVVGGLGWSVTARAVRRKIGVISLYLSIFLMSEFQERIELGVAQILEHRRS